jgi:hypothetical protein
MCDMWMSGMFRITWKLLYIVYFYLITHINSVLFMERKKEHKVMHMC